MSAFLAAEQGSVVLAAGESSTRTVYLIIAGLAAIGIALILLALWLIRATRPENELLAPLERMSDREWRTKNPAGQRRDLDALRPSGAVPKNPEPSVPSIDEEFARSKPELGSFDDLSDKPVFPVPVPNGAEFAAPDAADVAAPDGVEVDDVESAAPDGVEVVAPDGKAEPDVAESDGAEPDVERSEGPEPDDVDVEELDDSGAPIDQSVDTLDREDVEH